tara:strand:+ start:1453 stop:2031 length:579 start_codon:yes stop_codon:yes gene_type:complete
MYVFGNGESRTSINIDNLVGTKVGCNAIYRDYNMDHLICVDRRMVQESLDKAANEHSYIYTREDWVGRFNAPRVRSVPKLPYVGTQRWDEPFQWGSGPYAVLLAAKLCNDRTVHLIGFDLHSTTATVNNVYKDTSNYDSSDKRAIDPRYWIHQIGMVFKYYTKINFILHHDNFELPDSWKYSNVSLDTFDNL